MSQDQIEPSKPSGNYQVLIPQEYYSHNHDDEISLLELFIILWKKRFWIIGVTGLITLFTIGYAYSLTPAYKATAYVLPPQLKDIDTLNLYAEKQVSKEGLTVKAYTPDNVYQQAIANLSSRQYQWEFFQEHNLSGLYMKQPDPAVRERDVFNSGFRSALEIDRGKDQNAVEVSISFQLWDAQKAADLLNDYIAYVNARTVNAIVNDIKGNVRLEKRRLKQDIDRMRRDAFLQRKDRIEQIKEQLTVARKLNIQTSKLAGGVSTSASDKGNVPSYLEGTKALQAKLDALQKRKSDDAYIPQLRESQARLALLEEVDINEKNIRAFKVDQEALVPKYPIKPKKRRIVSLAFVLGLMASVFAVFVWHFIEKYRAELG